MSQPFHSGNDAGSRAWSVAGWLVATGLIVYLFAFFPAFSERSGSSAFGWLRSTWNGRNNLEHCYLLPLVAAGLLWRQRHQFSLTRAGAPLAGLLVLAGGVLVFIASMRSGQQRLAIASFPLFVVGTALYLGGPRTMKPLVFPACLIYFCVPIPGLLQATNGLQLVATRGAYAIAKLGGAAAVQAGNTIRSAHDTWGFDVAEGCSGIRSLMVLTLAAAIIGHLSQDRWWKKWLLFALAIPLAVFANAVRVGSVILLAEHGSVEFAASLYHDYSGLAFYLLALALLLAAAGLLRHEPARPLRVKVVRAKPTGLALREEIYES